MIVLSPCLLPSMKLLVVAAGLLSALPLAGRAETVASDMWTSAELNVLGSLWLGRLGPVPPDPSNRFADDPEAAALGEHFFFDTRFSDNNQVACATCHQPERYFTDGRRLAQGIGETLRGAPSLIGTSYSPWLYWDGRRDNHWSQALVPLETPVEHGFDRRRVLAVIAADDGYRTTYEKVFGALPGDGSDDETINRAFANVGKALAAYERGILPTPSRFDAYVEALLNDRADADPVLDPDEIAGLKLFISDEVQCTRCHNGPMFTNFGFHNIGLIQLKRGVRAYDVGRVRGTKEAQADPFRCSGVYSDAEPGECTEEQFIRMKGQELAGAFKVPTLRNIAETAPYMHTGQFATLDEVLKHYRTPPKGGLGHLELNPLDLTDREAKQIVAFLGSLTGPPPAASTELLKLDVR